MPTRVLRRGTGEDVERRSVMLICNETKEGGRYVLRIVFHILQKTRIPNGNHSVRSYQETRLGVTDVNCIPGGDSDNTLTFCVHSTAMRAFATGTQVLKR